MPGLRAAPRAVHTLRFGAASVRIGPWSPDPGVARLVASPGGALDRTAVRECIERSRVLGYHSVVTNALDPRETMPFAACGFTVRERLHLLVAELDGPAEPFIPKFGAPKLGAPEAGIAAPVLTRVRRRDHDAVLALDEAAFDPDWQLGPGGLRDALSATPQRQFRATRTTRDNPITGYAITGLAGATGYLQRIATLPDARRRGIARALVFDGFAFSWRRGASRVYVNTQSDNDAALSLYLSCGFNPMPDGLEVMERTL